MQTMTANRLFTFKQLLAVGFFAILFAFFPIKANAETEIQKSCDPLIFETGHWYCYFHSPTPIGGSDGRMTIYNNIWSETSNLILDGAYQSSNTKFEVDTYLATTTFQYRRFYDVGGTTDDWIYQFELDGSDPVQTFGTQISTTTPNNNQVIATSTETHFEYRGYLAEGDWNTSSTITWVISKSRICKDTTCLTFLPSDTLVRSRENVEEYGYISDTYDHEQLLPIGKYYMFFDITKGTYCALGICLGAEIVYTKMTTFTVSTTTNRDAIREEAEARAQALDNEQDNAFLDSCHIGDFDLFDCMIGIVGYLFVPSDVTEELVIFKNEIITRFPIGYFTDFVSIISTTTEGTLIPINATIPNGVIGTGATVTLDLTHSLDTMLNATTGVFTNVSASSTETFFEITNYYWKIVLYILAVLYIIRRITGIHFGGFGERGALSDQNSNDDSYRLKEELYRIRNRK